jgi:hypothetical protein
MAEEVKEGNMTPVDGGAWLRYDAFGMPIAAFAADLTRGPITVLWKGSVDVPHLHQFFAHTARVAFSREKVRYRTHILTGTDRTVTESSDAPPLGRSADEAHFVRFECTPATGPEASAPEPDPVLVAWAVLDQPEDTQESIGVYFRREDLPVILPQLESLVIGTAMSESPIPRDRGILSFTARTDETCAVRLEPRPRLSLAGNCLY